MGRMRGTGPARIRLLWVFARRCILYNLALAVLGFVAVFAFVFATDENSESTQLVSRSVRIAVPMTAILIVSAAQVLALLAMRLFHGRELPYYRNAGIGEGYLVLGSWVMAGAVSAIVLLLAYLAGSLWT